MTKPLVHQLFNTTEDGVLLGNRLELAVIALKIDFERGPLPSRYVECMALVQAICAEVKNIDQEEHYKLLASGISELRKKISFGILRDANSREVFYREDAMGVIVLTDTSFSSTHEQFWRLSLLFFPEPVLEELHIVAEL